MSYLQVEVADPHHQPQVEVAGPCSRTQAGAVDSDSQPSKFYRLSLKDNENHGCDPYNTFPTNPQFLHEWAGFLEAR